MDQQRWSKINEVFAAWLDLESHQRSRFVAEACGDDEILKNEVQKLIDAHLESQSFIDTSIFDDAARFMAEEDFLNVHQQIGAYKILKEIGRGGMGVVYLAARADEEYKKQVAIKLIKRGMDTKQVLRRFQTERQILANFDHPNIARLLDGGSTSDGLPYFVMEHVEGQRIDQYCNENNLSITDRLTLFLQACSAVSHAHRKLVIHRDIKPGNILVTADGIPKLMDFGIAKILQSDSDEQSTETGFRPMTPEYASPEQALGERLTVLSDIFSLGVLLYELLTGHLPYRLKSTSPAEIGRIFLDKRPQLPSNIVNTLEQGVTPEIVSKCREGTPQPPRRRLRGDLDNIVLMAIRTEPDRRYQTVEHFSEDIRRYLERRPVMARRDTLFYRGTKFINRNKVAFAFAAMAFISLALLTIMALTVGWKKIGLEKSKTSPFAVHTIQSLAVLPLKNLSGDAAQEYFADGMTEELISKLARIGSLRVISRTSVMEYKNVSKPIADIGKELEVDAVIEGSILRDGNSVRITAQLIDAATDRHLWAESYERQLEDILTLQNEVASAIAKEIQIKLAPEEAAQLTNARRVNPEAYQAYLRGLTYAEGEITEKNLLLAVEMFQKAVELDPNFALAYAELSKAHAFMHFTMDRTAERLAKSKAAVDRAFLLQPGLAEGHIALGFYYYRGFRDYDRTLQEFKIAKKTLPNDKSMIAAEGAIFRRQSKWEEALRVEKKVLALNPRDPLSAFDLATTYMLTRKYAEAQQHYDLSISLRPDEVNGYLGSAQNQVLWKGHTKGAREILDRVPEKKNGGFILLSSWIELLDRRYEAALELLSSPYAFQPRKGISEGILYRLMKNPLLARASFDAARQRLEKRTREKPQDHDLHRFLGLAYAGLGRKAEAIREGKRATELVPVSKDALWGPEQTEDLAFIYLMVGEKNAAMDHLEYLLSIPYDLSIPLLRIDPRWDSIRNEPRFRKIVAESH